MPANICSGMTYHDDAVHIRAGLQCLVDIGLQRDWPAAANAFIGSDHCLAVRIEDAVLDGLRRKAAKDNGVYCADACTGEHGVDCFRNHRHVDTDAVTFFYIAGLEHVRHAANMPV